MIPDNVPGVEGLPQWVGRTSSGSRGGPGRSPTVAPQLLLAYLGIREAFTFNLTF
jgi:hypothetical protein